jgi:hypothetical protein
MGPTLTLISLKNGRRLAAYAQSSWDVSSGYVHGYNNVLYSFNKKKYRKSTRLPQYGQYNKAYRGPTFGGGHDFCMYTDMTKVGYCRSHSFSGAATPLDVCGDLRWGGGNVVHLEVYYRGPVRHEAKHLEVWTMTTDISAVIPAPSPPPVPPPPPLPPPPPPLPSSAH